MIEAFELYNLLRVLGEENASQLEEIKIQLAQQTELQLGFNHWSLALAAMNIGLMFILIIVLIWGTRR